MKILYICSYRICDNNPLLIQFYVDILTKVFTIHCSNDLPTIHKMWILNKLHVLRNS